jgi:4a-hydroxytetrahydrobiopterin dehydratase
VERLTVEQIDRAVEDGAWTREGSGDRVALVRVVEAASYPEALGLIVAVGCVAERLGHHPDIELSWRRLTLRLSTHSVGGVTDADIRLAEELDAVLPGEAPSHRRTS